MFLWDYTSNCTFSVWGGKEEGNQFFARAQSKVLLNVWQIAQCWGSALAKLEKLKSTVFAFKYPQNQSIPQVLCGAQLQACPFYKSRGVERDTRGGLPASNREVTKWSILSLGSINNHCWSLLGHIFTSIFFLAFPKTSSQKEMIKADLQRSCFFMSYLFWESLTLVRLKEK